MTVTICKVTHRHNRFAGNFARGDYVGREGKYEKREIKPKLVAVILERPYRLPDGDDSLSDRPARQRDF